MKNLIFNLLRKGKYLTEIVFELKGENKKVFLLKKGINAYIRGNGKLSFESIKYASQLWTEDEKIKKLLGLIEKEFPDLEEQKTFIYGVTVVDMKLQQASALYCLLRL